MASDNLDFSIEEWTADGRDLVVVLARAGHIHVATAAWWAAISVRPRATVRLRKDALVMREKLPTVASDNLTQGGH